MARAPVRAANQVAPVAGSDGDTPARIGRRLSLALGALIGLVLVVGAASLFLSHRIALTGTRIEEENRHTEVVQEILAGLYRVHLLLNKPADPAGHRDQWIRAGSREIHALMSRFLDMHRRPDQGMPPRELALFADLRQTAGALLAVVEWTDESPPSVAREQLAAMEARLRAMPETVRQLRALHEAEVRSLLASNRLRMQWLHGLYAAFVLLGGLLVAIGSLTVSRVVVLPLRRLADAALDLARGDFRRRVSIESRDEIGQVSRAFNAMAGQLERREEDLRMAGRALERQVQETRSLLQIGMEISALLDPERLLRLVAEKARDLLGVEIAVTCLAHGEEQALVAKAAVGPAEAFRPDGGAAAGSDATRLLSPEAQVFPLDGDGTGHELHCALLNRDLLRAHLAAPLRRGERILGALCVGGVEPRTFAQAERDLLQGLANYAAIAIENARLYEEVRGVATLAERERIAREMHDGLAQDLAALHLHLKAIEASLHAGGPGELRADLHDMERILRGAYEEVRQAIFGLRTMVSRGLGLVPTLTEYLHELSRQHGLQVSLEVADERAARLAPAAEVQVIRIIQEALTNARKHARATRAIVRFEADDGFARITVEDHGQGLAPSTVAGRDPLHFGMQTMRERAEGLAGTLHVESEPGRGVRVIARVPLASGGTP